MTDQRNFIQVGINGEFDKRDPYVALSESQFVPFFQPVITLRTGQLAGFEVLARWQHPIEGIIAPVHFIAMAERDGWIGELNRQILPKAFAAVAAISDELTLAINVSPLQLRDPSLPEQFCTMASENGFSMSRLIVEITESALIDDLAGATRIVSELKAMGCKLALDDFGTGYSSLLHLQSLPFDELKVDRSFVSSMIDKRESRKIVSAVVGLGQSLSLITVAEGIETQEQAELMLVLGCELGQGYFFGRPMPTEQLAASVFTPRAPIVTSNLSPWKTLPSADRSVSPSQRLAQLRAVYDGAPVGLAFIDHNLRYLNLNKRLADMNGATVEAHLGNQVSEMIPHLFPQVEPYLHRALKGEVLEDVEAQLPDSQTTRLISYQPALDESGEVIGVAIAVTDITERKRTQEALKISEAYYRNAVELDPHLLWIMDPQGRNLDISPRWDNATGLLKPQTNDHEWLASVHPDDVQTTVQAITHSRDTKSPIDVQYRAADATGGWRWKRSKGSPRFDIKGNIVCWYGSVQEIDEPSQPREKVAVSRANTSASQELPGVSLPVGLVEEERRLRALLDLEILDTPAEAEFNDLVDLASEICAAPISLVSLVADRRQWFKASIGVAACETPIEVSFCAHAIKQRGIFVVEDATSDERFRDNPLVVGDPEIRFYAGVPLYAEGGAAIGTLCVADTTPRTLSARQAKALAILGQQVQARLELRSERKKHLKAAADSGKLTQQLQVSDQTLLEANSRLEQLATTDAITGLLNRRAFEIKVYAEFANAKRKVRALSLLVIEIDDYKKRTDEFGHAAGEEALRHVGEVLRKTIRAVDCAARIGGEEFAVVLPETSLEKARILAKRVQALLGLGAADFPRFSVSIGISSLEAAMPDCDALFAEAKLTMYKAKRAGKDLSVVHESRHVA